MSNGMKNILRLLLRILLGPALGWGIAVSCYNDSDLLEQLKAHQDRLDGLKAACNRQNTNLKSLQTFVIAVQNSESVTDISPVKEGENIVGYTVTFSRSGMVTIHDGRDVYAPAIGMRQDEDGQWFWTIDEEWMTDDFGRRVPAVASDGPAGNMGVTPELKVNDGYWYVSYDGGMTWEDEPLGQATGNDGYSMFEKVEYDNEYLYITIAGGEDLKIPRSVREQGDNVVGPVTVALDKVTAMTALFKGCVDLPKEELPFCRIGICYQESDFFHIRLASRSYALSFDENNGFQIECGNLLCGTTYKYCLYVEYRGEISYSRNLMSFTTDDLNVDLRLDEQSITQNTAIISGTVSGLSDEDVLHSFGIQYYSDSLSSYKIYAYPDEHGEFELNLAGLSPDTEYFFRWFVGKSVRDDLNSSRMLYHYGKEQGFTTLPITYDYQSNLSLGSAIDLSSSGFANSYVISSPGLYRFRAVRGNSTERLDDAVAGAILWESFGTSQAPERFELIKAICCKSGYIVVQTADEFKEGNAVVAAKDADGNILWSWHLWLTDVPQSHTYYNDAGTVMDRNLGAVSAISGDAGALGLLYQWGRKDPFPGSSSIESTVPAESTVDWPTATASDSETGTIEYSIAHPMVFITGNDWVYDGDNVRWTTSENTKSVYDPCPAGWRVPDGGENGLWAKALGVSSGKYSFDNSYKGMNLSSKLGESSVIWYPACGSRNYSGGNMYDCGSSGYYWSASTVNGGSKSYYQCFGSGGNVNLLYSESRAYGFSVRCVHE